jgi:hypothetical protein
MAQVWLSMAGGRSIREYNTAECPLDRPTGMTIAFLDEATSASWTVPGPPSIAR